MGPGVPHLDYSKFNALTISLNFAEMKQKQLKGNKSFALILSLR